MGMTDIGKTIENLSLLRERLKLQKDILGYGLHIDDLSSAIALLKEKEAVEARKKNDGKPQPWTSWWYVCGDCGQEIEYHDRFCRWCGRAVKW